MSCPVGSPRLAPGIRAAWLGLGLLMSCAGAGFAQTRPYLGYAYPAGGQQGVTVQVRLGGQSLNGADRVLVTGSGVQARVVECYRRLNNQEVQLLNEQLRDLKRATSAVASAMAPMMSSDSTMMMSGPGGEKGSSAGASDVAARPMIGRIERRVREFVQTPACESIAALAVIEVVIAPDATPGERELRLVTPTGISNPLTFCVGQVPEFSRKPMLTSSKQILGKEELALRKRPADKAEQRVALPCTLNGQIGSGEVDRYRFPARRGQRLVITTQARQLVPFIADAVPGWFQPVLALYDQQGREVAFGDDYRFKPDPTILYEVPKDGEYTVEIRDSIYRGREDFVYRLTLGELPFVTSAFPLGGRAGAPAPVKLTAWNLDQAAFTPPKDVRPGTLAITACQGGFVANQIPFALDTLPECLEKEPNNEAARAQKVTLPVIVNGRIGKPDDWDVLQFTGRSNDWVVAEVIARRLDSPLDSVIKLTDAKGVVLAFNDDHEDLASALNTHQADSRIMVQLPADGVYCLHLGDTGRKGGEEYGYRLRLSAPRPDFALRSVPSSVSLRGKSTATLSVHAQRLDGFDGPIRVALRNPPPGFSAMPVTLFATQTVARLTLKCDLPATPEPVSLVIQGSARIGENEIVREAMPAEDRMQAFLWRHLVPASELKVLAFNPANEPRPRRSAPAAKSSRVATNMMASATTSTATNAAAAKPKFTRQQINSRLRQLRLLYEEDLLTDRFYREKVAECETAL